MFLQSNNLALSIPGNHMLVFASIVNMRRLNVAINDYVYRITNNDPALQEIHLGGMMYSDEDIAPLMKALVDNPMAAQRIKVLELSSSEITKINVQILSNLEDLYISYSKLEYIDVHGLKSLKNIRLENNNIKCIDVEGLYALETLDLALNKFTNISVKGLNNLKYLYLSRNQLKDINVRGLHGLKLLVIDGNPLSHASVIALKALSHTKNFILSGAATNVTSATPLTREVLDAHFKPILTISCDSINNYTGQVAALISSSPLPSDIIFNILKTDHEEAVALAQDSMDNFKAIFTAYGEENQQLKHLIDYEKNELKNLIQSNRKQYYNKIIKMEEDFICIKNKRSSLVFSSTPNRSYECGFKPGFISARAKLGL